MKTLEVVHLRLAWKDPNGLVEEIQKMAGRNSEGMEIRVYRHAWVEGDLRVHLYRGEGAGGKEPSALGERVASMLRKHGMVDHSVWSEVGEKNPK